eukprot:4537015-Amphidinium_carterae.1
MIGRRLPERRVRLLVLLTVVVPTEVERSRRFMLTLHEETKHLLVFAVCKIARKMELNRTIANVSPIIWN